jgi:hypothetical protein
LSGYIAAMRQFLLTALTAFSLSPAFGQESLPPGIGFAQAEEGTWFCRDDDPGEALSCAREHCLEEGAGQECLPTAWCYPALWSGVMTVWLPDFHGARVLCGLDDEESLKAMLAAFCLTQEEATRCELTLTVDPEGHERDVTGVSFPGGGAPPPAEEEAAPADAAATAGTPNETEARADAASPDESKPEPKP